MDKVKIVEDILLENLIEVTLAMQYMTI